MQTLILKVAKSGDDGEKVLVILESGVRFHATEYMREKNMVPESFCMKLRKHLRGKRLVDIAQLGVDRVVAFTFGGGEGEHHLLLELYASVRIILHEFKFSSQSHACQLRTYACGRASLGQQRQHV
jgi:predicted ribosome quality control (RQC) complex YloA/Tae2 family protein